MRKPSLLSTIIIIGLLFLSCSTNDSYDAMPSTQDMQSGVTTQKRVINNPSRWDLESMLNEYPEIFGEHVLIFDSLPCADSLLNELNECDPENLRLMYSELGVQNTIFESNIVYDSVMNDVADNLNINLESSSLSDSTYLEFWERFVDEMISNFSEFCTIEEGTTNNNEFYYTVNPIGNLDERALCNEKKIFIADEVIFKFSGDYLLTCNADTYLSLAQYDDLEILQGLLNHSEISGVNDSDYVICKLDNHENADSERRFPARINLENDHYRHFWGIDNINGNRRVDVSINVYPYWRWFHTHFRCKMTISNYFRGTAVKANVNCCFHCFAFGWRNNSDPLGIFFLKYMYGLNTIFNCFKSRSFTQHDDCCFSPSSANTYADIYYLYLDLIQNSGSDYEITLFEEEEPNQ